MCVRNSRGFTLLEILISVAIVAILSTVAIPAYSSYKQHGNRITAFDSLQELANKQERFYSRQGTYTRSEKDLGYASNGWQVSPDGYYEYQVTNASTTHFNAVARVLGDQSNDSINRFRLRSDGTKHHWKAGASRWTTGWED